MGTLQIHSENILPILKKWLYSDKEIFVRELVSNACDAIAKLRHLSQTGEGRIDIAIEGDTLRFSDTGLGMTAEEVEKYIAQLAFSGAEEFVKTYEAKEEMIGHFGLGFYSAYMVAETVEILTRSHTGADPVHWQCDGSSEYTLEPATREETGTDVILHIEDREYLEIERIRTILRKYCSFLSTPIYLQGERINGTEPLWIKAPAECTEEEYRGFYRLLYPMEEEPLFWIHLNVDVPFHLKGILYFPRLRRDFDFSKNAIQLYSNRVFVSDSCKDLLPDYLMALRGAIAADRTSYLALPTAPSH